MSLDDLDMTLTVSGDRASAWVMRDLHKLYRCLTDISVSVTSPPAAAGQVVCDEAGKSITMVI